MAQAKRDENSIPALLGVSNADGVTPIVVYVDPVTHRLLVDLAGGSGTVTSVSVVTANGISGSVATATTTPAITLALGVITPTSVNGLTLAAQAIGFTIAGGTTSKTLTVALDASVSGTNTGDNAANTSALALDQTTPQTIINGQPIQNTLTALELVATAADKKLQSLAVATYPSLTEISYIKGLTSALQTQLNGKAATLAGTINEIAYFNSASTIASLAVATYPSLTELSYVKGVTSALQTQLGALVPKSTYNAHTILYATTDDTPAALTVGEQTVVGRATGGNISALAIDSDLSSVSANDDTIPSAKATKAMGDLKLPLAGGTMTGPIVQGSYINLSSPASDHTATGLTTNAYQAGATVAAFELVFMGSASKWLLVDADAVATCKGLLAIALEAKNDTQAMLVALPGTLVRDDTWAWTVGATLYAGETPGTMQEAIPTGADAIIKVVGFAMTADVIFFNPSPDQQSTVA